MRPLGNGHFGPAGERPYIPLFGCAKLNLKLDCGVLLLQQLALAELLGLLALDDLVVFRKQTVQFCETRLVAVRHVLVFQLGYLLCARFLATLRLRKLLALIHLARLEMPDLRLECVPLLCEAIAACRLDFPRLLQVVDALCQCLDLCPQAGLCPLHFLCFYQLLRLGTQAIFKACPLFDLRLLEMLGFVVVARQDVRLVRLVVNEGLGHAEVLFDAILLLAKSGCDSFETREHGEPKFVDCRHVYAAPVASILQELGKIECGIGLAGLVTRVIRVAAIARLQRMLARGRVRVGRSASRRHFHHSSGVMAVLRSPLFRLCCWWRYWCGVDRKASQLHRLTGKLFDLPNNNQLIMRDVFPLGSRCTSFLCLKVVWVV
eukprot:Opistho-2@62456